MRFGVCTWTFGNLPLAALAKRVKGVGLDGVELEGNLDASPREIKRVLKGEGLEVLSITPDDVDILHPDVAVREPAIHYYLRLLDWAAEVGAPVVSCHGAVGRVRVVSSQEEEWALYLEAVKRIGARAAELGIKLAMELLNRYESHFLRTVDEGLQFVDELGQDNVGLLLDAYHMNIEEPDLPRAIWRAADRLTLFHAADSNREAVGRGHTDFQAIARALKANRYRGDLVFECVASGPDPFTWDKGEGTVEQLERFLRESLQLMRHYLMVA